MGSTRERILNEATKQLLRVGYAAFTVASVRDALRLSSGSMFHAFSSKQALAAAVYVEGMSDYQRVAIAAVDAATDAMTALNAWIAAHLSWVQQRRALAGFLFGTLPDEVMVLASEPLSECNAAFYARMESLFRSAVDAGLMGEVDLSLAYALCIGPAQEYCRRWTRGAAATPPRALTGALQTAALAALATTCPRMRNIDKRAATQRGRARDRKARHQTP